MEPEAADFDHFGVVDEHVVADLLQHRRVERGDGDLVARLAHGRHRLDVVPVPVRLEHPLHAEALAQVEELLVLVGGVEENRLTGRETAHHEHVVLVRPDHHLVHLGIGVRPVERVGSRHSHSLAVVERTTG